MYSLALCVYLTVSIERCESKGERGEWQETGLHQLGVQPHALQLCGWDRIRAYLQPAMQMTLS